MQTITFRTADALAEFLAALFRHAPTRTFEVVEEPNRWVLTFTGGF